MSAPSVTITDPGLRAEAEKLVAGLIADKVASSIAAKDATLWGPDAESESAIRLNWVDLPRTSRPLLGQVSALREKLRVAGVDRVVLAGMGGSSLAPEVFARTEGVPLTVLDTTDPGQVADALAGDLGATVLVVSSKSGSTVETDSHFRIFAERFTAAGLDPAGHVVVVTDPGSPLQGRAAEAGLTVVKADPHVGGRYSALTAFGLVPAGLAGVDITRVLDDAATAADVLSADTPDNPGLLLGAALGARHAGGAEKVVLADTGSGVTGFGDWAEQLVAESTGKEGTGILPVVVEGVDAPGFVGGGPDVHRLVLGPGRPGLDATSVSGSLGAQFLLWEYATAVAGRVLGINPFDQPNVTESKENTSAILDESGGSLPEGEPALVDGAVEVHGDLAALGAADDLTGVLRGLLDQVPDRGYLAVMAYLDREGDDDAAGLRPLLARAAGQRQVTFGWAPRFLHSTGQFHKGGPQVGVFLQVTGAVTSDVPVPGRPFTFGQLEMAQALGDQRALAGRHRPVFRLHLTDRRAGLAQLLEAGEKTGGRGR